MATWRNLKNGRVHDILVTHNDTPPKEGYERVPDNWGGSHGDKAEWFDDTGIRVPDKQLVETGLRTDNRGTWYSTEKQSETKQIRDLDVAPGENWTREKPLENEAHQKWDGAHWVVDEEKKEAAEKENQIAALQSQIVEYESKVQRPLIALADPDITPEQKATEQSYYAGYKSKIEELRAQKQELLSA